MELRTKRSVFLVISLVVTVLTGAAWAARSEKPATVIIPLGVLESFSLSETLSIERMRSAFESALYYSIGENEKDLAKCGYGIRVVTEYYDNSDRLAPKDRATILENGGAFMILGPRRSEQFLVASHGVNKTPIISPAAASIEAHKLKPPFFTMFPTVGEFTSALLKAIEREKYGTRFASLTDVTCLACRDFESEFEALSVKRKLTKQFGLELAVENPDLKPLIAKLRTHSIDFLFLPVYAKTAAQVIHALHPEFPQLKYVGPHTWGDAAYGLFEDHPIDPGVKAIAINSNASPEVMSSIFRVGSLGRATRTGTYGPPSWAYRVLNFVRILTRDLCMRDRQKKSRLQTKEDFRLFFSSLPENHFQADSVLGIFRLEKGGLNFAYLVTP